MIDRIKDLDEIADMEAIMSMVFDDTNQGGQAPRGSEPLFYTTVTLDDTRELPPNEIIEIKIDDFVPPPRGKSVDEDFDLLAHIEKEEPKDDDDAGGVDDEEYGE